MGKWVFWNFSTIRGLIFLFIPVDIFKPPDDYGNINKIAKEYNIFVIGNAVQSFGGGYTSRKGWSLADIGRNSFSLIKPLGYYGDGGMIFTCNQEIIINIISW